MQVRVATAHDVELVSALNTDVQRVLAGALPQLFKQPSDETFPPSAVCELLDDPNNCIFIAHVDGEVTGYVYAEIRNLPENPFHYAMTHVCIHHISVRPGRRHKGCGGMLIQAVKALARARGINMITLDVWSVNTPARAFFAGQGFTTFN